MTHSREEFGLFADEYASWKRHTQALPFRCSRDLAKDAFEVSLDHLIDYLQPITAQAAQQSRQFDYPKVAAEYLADLDRITTELERSPLSDAERQLYSDYLVECRNLLLRLGELSVSEEGPFGFRESALLAFGFLVDEYGFKVAESSPIKVCFTSGATMVTIEHSPECPMNSLLVDRTDDQRPSTSGFILDDFAYVAGQGVLFDYEDFDLRDAISLRKFLDKAASLVRKSGGPLLSDDPTAFRDFQAKAEERERTYIEMMDREHSSS